MRTRSHLTRLIAAMTSLTTMLCLGCPGFEPMMDALDGSTTGYAMIACSGGDMGVTQPGAASDGRSAGAVSGDQAFVSAPGQSGAHARYDCGCQSCTAPAAAIATASIARAIPIHPSNSDVAELVGIVTQPLLPPPQRAL